MSKQPSPISEVVESWTRAEQDAWQAWSTVEQDLSQPESVSGCAHVLDALETCMRDGARLQSTMVRTMCEQMTANPFVPPPARTLFAQACGPLASIADVQQHLLVGWFGMARQMADLGQTRASGGPDSA